MTTAMIVKNKNLDLSDAKATSNRIPILSIHSPNSKKNGKPETAHLREMINQMVLINGGEYTNLGDSVEVMAITMRYKAQQYKDGAYGKTAYHGVDSGGDAELYAELRTASQNQTPGTKYGPEFLFYLPEYNSFATLFGGTTKEKDTFGQLIAEWLNAPEPRNTFTLRTKYLDGKQVKFERMIITAELSDLDFSGVQPDEEEFKQVVHKFLNPTVFIEDPGDER